LFQNAPRSCWRKKGVTEKKKKRGPWWITRRRKKRRRGRWGKDYGFYRSSTKTKKGREKKGEEGPYASSAQGKNGAREKKKKGLINQKREKADEGCDCPGRKKKSRSHERGEREAGGNAKEKSFPTGGEENLTSKEGKRK